MRKFTKEEIGLCRQVAESYVKAIQQGDWYYSKDLDGISYYYQIRTEMKPESHIIPLWTISDCLEFLREKCLDHVLLIHDKEDKVEWFLWMDEYKETQQMGKGKTPLEACLKAVLAVLEEKR